MFFQPAVLLSGSFSVLYLPWTMKIYEKEIPSPDTKLEIWSEADSFMIRTHVRTFLSRMSDLNEGLYDQLVTRRVRESLDRQATRGLKS